MFAPTPCCNFTFHSQYLGIVVATVLVKSGGTKKLVAAEMLASVPPPANPETKAAFELAASLNKLARSADARLLLNVLNEFSSGGLDDTSPAMMAAGKASMKRPTPPLSTVWFRPA